MAVTPRYPPRSMVGAWVATHQFLRHLTSLGHDVTAVPITMGRDSWSVDGVQVVATGMGSEIDRMVRDADVLLVHAGDNGAASRIARHRGVRTVCMVHGAGNQAIGNPDLAVFNSQALQAMSPHSCRSIVCHPPTDPVDHETGRGECVTIVNCTRDKGIKTAWRAAEHLPAHQFLGVKGGYGEQVCPRARNFEVIATQRDMRAVWARTRVLLMPSAYETWGMVGIEAMCSGIPVIAHPTPGLCESLGDAGIFVDRDDIDGWVEQIQRLDDPAEYATASAAARARVDVLVPEMRAGLDRFATELEALCG